jgi:hypothetical protein
MSADAVTVDIHGGADVGVSHEFLLHANRSHHCVNPHPIRLIMFSKTVGVIYEAVQRVQSAIRTGFFFGGSKLALFFNRSLYLTDS